ncbi:caspase domain-containing protein [Desarmillaria ectypa]|nr:caspase domain-containing protein [Desarmillaria ectypa]
MYFSFRRSRALNSVFQSFFSAACRPNSRCIEPGPVARKALLIGVSYTLKEYRSKPENQVEGALTDVRQTYDILTGPLNFKKEDITVLTDGPNAPRHLWPTKTNIEKAISTFVSGTESGDICFLFYAGHGHQIYNRSSPEKDKRDEHIVPCDAVDPNSDFIEGRMIIDDLLKNILVMPLAAMDAKLTISHTIAATTSRPGKELLSVYIDTDCDGFCLLPKRRGSGYIACISACRDEEFAWGEKWKKNQKQREDRKQNPSKIAQHPQPLAIGKPIFIPSFFMRLLNLYVQGHEPAFSVLIP